MTASRRILALHTIDRHFHVDGRTIRPRTDFVVPTEEQQQSLDYLVMDWGYELSPLTWDELVRAAREEVDD